MVDRAFTVQPATAGAGVLLSAPRATGHNNRMLAGLPEAELCRLEGHLQTVSLPPGTLLPPDHVYFPHEGVISLLAVTPRGETIEIASAGRSGMLGPILESTRVDSALCTIAHQALRASRISIGNLVAALADNPVLARTAAAGREAQLLQLQQNLLCTARHLVERRLVRWVLETADRLEAAVIPATQKQVSQRLGVRRTTVTLFAGKLTEIDAIRWDRARINIVDRQRLAAMTCTCYGALRDRIWTLLAPGATAMPHTFVD